MDDMQFFDIELPKIHVNNSREIDRILWMLSDIGDLLEDIQPCEGTDQHLSVIGMALEKLKECSEAHQHKTEEQAAFIDCFTAQFESFRKSFTEQAAYSTISAISERPRSGGKRPDVSMIVQTSSARSV